MINLKGCKAEVRENLLVLTLPLERESLGEEAAFLTKTLTPLDIRARQALAFAALTQDSASQLHSLAVATLALEEPKEEKKPEPKVEHEHVKAPKHTEPTHHSKPAKPTGK